MDRIEKLFPRYDEAGKELILRAYNIAAEALKEQKRSNGNPFIEHPVAVAKIACDEIGLSAECIAAVFLHEATRFFPETEIPKGSFGQDVMTMVDGLNKISTINPKDTRLEAENYKKLIVSYSKDPRVTVLKIADRLEVMRSLDMFPEKKRRDKSWESLNLYAQIAHKLGLYSIKSELEDLSLKYLEPEAYNHIVHELKESEAERMAFIESFLAPVRALLDRDGINYHIKSRTKSVFSIFQKMRKQRVDFHGVYDIFALRIIIDCPVEREKAQCWTVYSHVTSLYTPNPERMRDWISIPKSNGYESLHTTVSAGGGKWVEVQIRTERMDEVAERGLAAHWRYKGVKGESGLDEWLTSIRETLENAGSDLEVMDQFKLELYEDEVFVFTPKGDLFKLPKGSTVLDFAFSIHTKLGSKCIGAKVNGKNVQLRQQLNSGDQVEIMTSNTQTPKQDWLSIVTTSKARTKIRQALKEIEARQTEFAKETIERKFKNRKLEYDDSVMMRLIKKMGYKTVTLFYQDIAI